MWETMGSNARLCRYFRAHNAIRESLIVSTTRYLSMRSHLEKYNAPVSRRDKTLFPTVIFFNKFNFKSDPNVKSLGRVPVRGPPSRNGRGHRSNSRSRGYCNRNTTHNALRTRIIPGPNRAYRQFTEMPVRIHGYWSVSNSIDTFR